MERTSITRALILRILGDLDEGVPATRLVKLLYLVDYLHVRHKGSTATGLKYVWDDLGPNALRNRIIKEADALAAEGVIALDPGPGAETALRYRLISKTRASVSPLLDTIIRDVIYKYGRMSRQQLVAASKQTAPFETAKPGEPLEMRRSPRRPSRIAPDDWERHLRERATGRGKSIAELRADYDLIEADS